MVAGALKKAHSQDAIFSQFYANPLYLNPALTGAERCTRLVLNYRNHPFDSFGTFSTYSFSADTYIESLSGGVGINLVHDNQGDLLHHTQAGLFYAYHGRLSRHWFVNFGVQASYINYRLTDGSNLVFPDQYNPGGNTLGATQEALPDNLSSHNVDFSSGILFHNHSFYAGAAIHHMSQPPIDFFEDENVSMKYSLQAGYEFDLQPARRTSPRRGQDWSLSPNLIVQRQSGFLRFNYGMYFNIEPIITGLWFRHNMKHPNSLIFMVGLKQVNYSIGYSYDYSLSGFSGPANGAHEISVLLNFNCTDPKPRYRILNCPTF